MLNITYLKYFYDTIRFGSVSKASRQNYVSQSAVSQGIVKLEQALQVSLLTHRRNTIKITHEGQKILEHCQSIFHAIDELIQSVKSDKDEHSGDLSFSCTHSMALSLLPGVLSELHAVAPKVTPKIIPGHIGFVKEWLRQGRIEFGIVLENEDVSSLERIPIYTGSFKLYRSKKRKDVGFIDSIISTEPRPELNSMKKNYLKSCGIELKTVMEISSWEIIANLVAEDVGIGFIPDFLSLTPSRADQLVPCDFEPEPSPYVISVVYPKHEKLSRNAALFVSLFQECLTEWQCSKC